MNTITYMACPCCGKSKISLALVCKDHTVSAEDFEVWECADCTFRFTQNVPGQDFIAPYYQSDTYISHSDSEEGFVNKLYKYARNYTLKWKLNLLDKHITKGSLPKRLLDIGAGTGSFLHTAIKSGWEGTGLEPDAGARNVCWEKYKLTLEEPGKLFNLPAASYDAVSMWHVLEHVHQLHAYLDEIKRVLKPGGTVFIALPNYTSWDAAHYGPYWAAYDVPRHLYHFSPMAFRTLVTQHELELTGYRPMWLDAFYIALLSEQYKGGRSNMVAATLSGMKSDWTSFKEPSKCSSLVYVLKHRKG
jgi:SAM-dependent methyltransferase